MRIAMEKLLDGCRVNEVADYLHYASPFSFSKAYKNFFGWSPKHHLQILRMQKSLPPYNTENT